MAKIVLQRKSTALNPDNQSYRLVLEAVSSENITRNIFVNQRIRSFINNNSEDVFAAVATPAQLEDFGVDAPREGSSYFLINKIDIISRNAEYLEDIYEDIKSQVQKLVGDVEALENLTTDETIEIT